MQLVHRFLRASRLTLLGGSLLLAGCASGPRYSYTQAPDSARILAYNAPSPFPNDTSCYITVTKLDGRRLAFSASIPGLRRLLGKPSEPLYLSPGTHTMTLDLSEIDNVIGPNSDASGIVATDSSGGTKVIVFAFLRGHVYRMAGHLSGGAFDITLWDESDGAATRKVAGEWQMPSNTNHSDSPITGANKSGARLADIDSSYRMLPYQSQHPTRASGQRG